MAYYRTCPYCGCNIDAGERCDCRDVKPSAPSEPPKATLRHIPSPYERTRAQVYATGNRWAIENFKATH